MADGEAVQPQPEPPGAVPHPRGPLVPNAVLAEALTQADERQRLGLPAGEDEPLRIVVELNLRHARSLAGAEARFHELYAAVLGDTRPPPVEIADSYHGCSISVAEARRLAAADADRPLRERAIYRIWPDFPVEPLLDRSVSTVKGDAAQRSYAAMGEGITWAVLDSGIEATHPHFDRYGTLRGDVAELHRDFTADGELPPDESIARALVDGMGHGTHVAGIVAGGLPADAEGVRVVQNVAGASGAATEQIVVREVAEPERLAGVAPRCRLVSLKVLDDEGRGHSSNILRALRYLREEVNGTLQRVHGVNLSVGYEFDAKWFACGQSPLCVEVDRLVRSGVVVVVAAGNTGYGALSAAARRTNTGLALTINDPGNADLAITVGATHRDRPHTYGVSYFSSKGPTGDGRLKPDLVAPGERVTSCAAGQARAKALAGTDGPPAVYIDDSGTSMAAPHVSGAIAAFLSIRPEFTGQSERVKRIFLDSATSLGRVDHFQGRGLVDLMRAIQSV